MKYSHSEDERWRDKNHVCSSSELYTDMICYDKKIYEMCTSNNMKSYLSNQVVRVRTCTRSTCSAGAMYKHGHIVMTIKLDVLDEGRKCTHNWIVD